MSQSWITQNLNKHERVLFQTRLFMFPIIKYVQFCFIIPYLIYKHTEFTLTNQRVIVKKGIFSVHEEEIPLDKINSVRLDQNLIGRMFHYGNIHFETASSDGDLRYTKIAKAKDFKTQVASAQESFEETKVMHQAEILASAIAAKQQSHPN